MNGAGSPRLWIKVCGVCCVADAVACAEAGVDAIGLNFAPESPRRIDEDEARAIAGAVRGQVELVGVFVNPLLDHVKRVDAFLELDRIQLHGEESPAFCRALGSRVMKAFRVERDTDVRELALYDGDWFLLDARVRHVRGGSGQSFDWRLAAAAKEYGRIVVAGGLTPDNVGDAVRVARPDGVDTASGVERAPGMKDPKRVAEFVAAAREAAGAEP
jgi:phosphoribosylanthranilate isomerase